MKTNSHFDNRTLNSLILQTLAFVAVIMITGCNHTPPPTGGGIHGHVVVQMRSKGTKDGPNGAQGAPSRIELPNASVTATDAGGHTSAAVRTNAHGYFQLPHLAPGTYRVCGDAPGFVQGCLDKISVTSFSVVLADDVQVKPKLAAVAGTVVLSGKSPVPCFTDRPAFGTLVNATVTLEDTNHNRVAGPVDGNGLGQYVLPEVAASGKLEVVAKCHSAEGRAPLTLSGGETFQDVVIPNSPPSVLRLEATVANKAVRVVTPGGTVSLHAVAQDPDGNSLSFKWVDSNGTPITGVTDTVQLTLPSSKSSTSVFVEAGDGRGGFAYSTIPVTGASLKEALFTGTVVDADTGAPISGADVTVNGKSSSSDARGAFAAIVDVDVRYVVTVRKPEYALLSKVTYSPAAELRMPLQRVFPETFTIADGGQLTPKEGKNTRRPVGVLIPPNSLADKNGNPVGAGQGKAYMWGYPPDTPIPGDMSGVFEKRPARLETLGAMDVQLTDLAGQPLQVRSGGHVELVMSAAGNPNPPANVPLFTFDETKGLWVQDGEWKLQGTEYHAIVTHLSAFNADLAFGTTGCIEYHLDVENTPALPFYLHIEQQGQTANHEPFQVNDFAGVVSRLRPATQTDWWVLPTPTSAKIDAIGHGTVLSSNFTSDPNDPNGDFPVVGAIKNGQPVCTSFNIAAEFPLHETYLTGLTVGGAGTSPIDYRNAVDAWAVGGSRANFGDFKSTNNFNGSEASAVYFNNADLKLGRDMHCHRTIANRIACYVSNYLDHALPPASSLTALQAAAAGHNGGASLPFATVAMEWDPDPNHVDTSVQFFVYDGNGVRVNLAALDSEGAKPVPQICQACHGGYYDATDHLAHESRFIPFDVASFLTIDDLLTPPVVAQLGLTAFTRPNQLIQFQSLNNLMKQTEANRTLSPNALTQLIDGWYQPCGGGVAGPGCTSFDGNFRPSTWNANSNSQALYDNVVKPTCRGCHIMQPNFDWTDLNEFSVTRKTTIERYVCTGQFQPNNQRRMPHAEVPFKTFWESTLASGLMKQAPMNLANCQRQ
jgi:hypothetical protein